MPTATQNQHFDQKSAFVGERIRTCGYRFYKLIQTRRKQIPKLQSAVGNPKLQDEVRSNILNSADEYVNCLRMNHRGGQIPEYLVGTVNKFKQQAYTLLAPQCVLEDTRLEIATTIFNQNYKN